MRTLLLLLLTFFAGAVLGGVALVLWGDNRPQSTPSASAVTRPAAPASHDEATSQLMAAGRLREAQDAYLAELLSAGAEASHDAWQGLVGVRRQLAHHDPLVLRQQAAAYRQAIAEGVETEHYTKAALEVLATTSLRAAEEIEAELSGKPQAARVEVPTIPPALQSTSSSSREMKAQSPSPALQPVPVPSERPIERAPGATAGVSPETPPSINPQTHSAPSRGTAVPAPQPTPASPPPVAGTDPLYVVQVGPIVDAEQVSAIIGELTRGGFAPIVRKRDEPLRFRVSSDPHASSVVERRAAMLREQGFYPIVRALNDGLAELEFGRFASQRDAEVLAKRIRLQGFLTVVAREGGTFYTITLGPHRLRDIDAITTILKSRVRTASMVTVMKAARPPSGQGSGQ